MRRQFFGDADSGCGRKSGSDVSESEFRDRGSLYLYSKYQDC